MVKLTRLLNAEGETVGYFSDHLAEMTARKEWEQKQPLKSAHSCRMCGQWFEGPWSRALKGPEGDYQQSLYESYMCRGCCDECWQKRATPVCRSIETPIVPAELEDVEQGDGDRTDYVLCPLKRIADRLFVDDEDVDIRREQWLHRGAAEVEVSRHLINRWRRPSRSSRDADLGGAPEATGVLYVLRVKAPK